MKCSNVVDQVLAMIATSDDITMMTTSPAMIVVPPLNSHNNGSAIRGIDETGTLRSIEGMTIDRNGGHLDLDF